MKHEALIASWDAKKNRENFDICFLVTCQGIHVDLCFLPSAETNSLHLKIDGTDGRLSFTFSVPAHGKGAMFLLW